MLIGFFLKVKEYKVPCTIRELLDLIRALKNHLAFADMEAFYYLSRTILVKDEAYFDRFDRAFADYFKGVESLELDLSKIPEDWLKKDLMRMLSDEEKKQVEALGGLQSGIYFCHHAIPNDSLGDK